MESESSKAFLKWRRRMGLTYSQVSESLGISASVAGFYSRGTRRNKKKDDEKIVEVPKSILLACSAVENNLNPIE